MKGASLGLIFGILLGAAGVRVVDRVHGAKLEEAGKAVGERDPRLRESEDAVGKLEKALADARAENAALAGRVSELEAKKSAPAPAETAVAVAAERKNPWKELGASLYKLRDKMKDGGDSPEAQQVMMELLGLIGKIAKENGVTIEEAMLSPDGFPMLMLSILDAAGVTPDAVQAQKIEEILAGGREAWKEYLGHRGDLSRLEQRRDLMLLDAKTAEAIRQSFSSGQEGTLKEIGLFDANINFGNNHHIGGSRESIVEGLKSGWASDLKLDDAQKSMLAPVVDDYMRGYDAMQEDWARRAQAGQKVTSRQRSAEEVDLMIRTQKRIGDTVRLDDKQAEALKNWATSYGYTYSEPGR